MIQASYAIVPDFFNSLLGDVCNTTATLCVVSQRRYTIQVTVN